MAFNLPITYSQLPAHVSTFGRRLSVSATAVSRTDAKAVDWVKETASFFEQDARPIMLFDGTATALNLTTRKCSTLILLSVCLIMSFQCRFNCYFVLEMMSKVVYSMLCYTKLLVSDWYGFEVNIYTVCIEKQIVVKLRAGNYVDMMYAIYFAW